MSVKSKILAASAVLTLLGGTGITTAALTAGSAQATTLTCTNIKNAITSPFGCGGLQTAPGYPGGILAIRADGNYNNAVIRVEPGTNVLDPNQDFTAFPVCGETEGIPLEITAKTDASACLAGSVGNLGRYVGMFTPLGNIPSFTVTALGPAPADPIANPPDTGCAGQKPGDLHATFTSQVPCAGTSFTVGGNTFCISITKERNGPRHAIRWNVILRPCAPGGIFTYGNDVTSGFVTAGFGNAYQEWAPIDGQFGIELANVWVFNHGNVEYTLNIAGNGGAGTHLIAYPLGAPALNESWDGVGCTPPLTSLVAAGQIPASYALCP